MDHYEINKNTFNTLAKAYQDRYMSFEGYLDTFDLFVETMAIDDAKILEVACGPGNVTKYLLSQKPNFKIYGIDIAPKMIELARVNNPEAHYDVMDCRHLSHISDRFDAIICAFGVPYINHEDTIKFIEDSGKLLNENGLLYLSTMEGNYEDNEYVQSSAYKEKTYVYYHHASSLIAAFNANQMEVIHEIRKPYRNEAGKDFIDLFLIVRKSI